MTTDNAPLSGLLSDDPALERVAAGLAERFAPVLGASTVSRYVRRAYASLAGTAPVRAHLVPSTERLAISQLAALARAAAVVSRLETPTIVLYDNASSGRAQIAAAWLNHRAQGRVRVHTVGAAPAPPLVPRILEILSRMGLHPDYEEPGAPSVELLTEAHLVVLLDSEQPADLSVTGSNRIYWPTVAAVSADDFYQTLAMTTELNLEVGRLLADLRI